MGDDSNPTRRSVLRATGAAVGAAAVAAGGLGTATASGCRVLEYDWVVNFDCPPITDPTGPIVEAGTRAFEACTDEDGNVYMLVNDGNGWGYVPKSATVPC